jgi:hypothetical protein
MESNYRLRIIQDLQEEKNSGLEKLIQESKEIKKLLAAIINKMNLDK